MRRLAAAYMIRVGVVVCSVNSLIVEPLRERLVEDRREAPVGVGAEPDPLQRRRAVTGEGELLGRVVVSFTGRSTTLAASAASTTFGRGVPLEPKPPPTCGESTRTWSGAMANSFASVSRTGATPWLESCSVSVPLSQTRSSRAAPSGCCGARASSRSRRG